MIVRDLGAASRRGFDLVVVGGGIYGVSLLREAARHGLSACLCEAGDFGGGTSWNSLRIVHGGLRYLQTLDLRRFFQSVAARREFAQLFPTLVRPLPCLMPLYGQGMKCVSVLRGALLFNDLLGARRNAGLPAPVHLPPGRVVDAPATRRLFPWVRERGLQGAACWSDYFMVSSERLLVELLRDACRHGALALNYTEALRLERDGGRVAGVAVRDRATGEEHTIAGRVVVDCTGPAVGRLFEEGSSPQPPLFTPSLAFNLLLRIEAPLEAAVAVASPQPGAPVLFILPWQGALLAGTMHAPRPPGTTTAVPTEGEIAGFLAQLNAAIPALGAKVEHVVRTFAGLLPVAAPGSVALQKRETILSDGSGGSIEGLVRVSGVKYTTAADVARQVLRRTWPDLRLVAGPAAIAVQEGTPLLTDSRRACAAGGPALTDLLGRIAAEESVLCLEDLVLRRTNWATSADDLEPLFALAQGALDRPRGFHGPGYD